MDITRSDLVAAFRRTPHSNTVPFRYYPQVLLEVIQPTEYDTSINLRRLAQVRFEVARRTVPLVRDLPEVVEALLSYARSQAAIAKDPSNFLKGLSKNPPSEFEYLRSSKAQLNPEARAMLGIGITITFGWLLACDPQSLVPHLRD